MRCAIAVALSFLALVGCQSPFVGHWVASDLSELITAEQIDRVILDIKSDGTFVGVLESQSGTVQGGAVGTWTRAPKSQVRFKANANFQ